MRTRKFQTTIFVIAILFTIGILGCGKATDPKTDFQYPLQVGNSWEFSYTHELSNIRGDEQATQDFIDSWPSETMLLHIIGKDTVDNTIETFVMQSSFSQNNAPSRDSGLTYLNNTVQGLIIFYSNTRISFTLHKPKHTDYLLSYNNKTYSSFEELTASAPGDIPIGKVTMANSSLVDYDDYLTLAYPLSIGQTWIATYSTSIGYLRKTIDRFENITVPAGEFSCYVIDNRFHSHDGEAIWIDAFRTDYISAQGLIKRVVRYNDIQLVDYSSTVLATIDLTTTYELTDMTLIK